MSHQVSLDIVVIGMMALTEAVVQCGLDFVESKRYTTTNGDEHAVDLIVTDEVGTKVGVKVDKKTGVATFIADEQNIKAGTALAQRVAQRWAHSKITEELKRKGYQLTETKQPDGTIKINASKWK